jgi:hypothetical protein
LFEVLPHDSGRTYDVIASVLFNGVVQKKIEKVIQLILVSSTQVRVS